MSRILAIFAIAFAVAGASMAMAESAGLKVQKYPDVVDVRVHVRSDSRFDFDATISSPYDTPQRYADAFRVMSTEGIQFGERNLLHDHANQQPFTRDLYGVAIPAGIKTVVIQARDKQYGYGGKTIQVTLPGR
ncbi:MAG: hypothetical protein ACOH1Q_06735 [Thiobacillus sp.]